MKRGLELPGRGTKVSENQDDSFAFHYMTNTGAINTSVPQGAMPTQADSPYTISNTGTVYEDITMYVPIVPNFGITLTDSMSMDLLLDLQNGDGDN